MALGVFLLYLHPLSSLDSFLTCKLATYKYVRHFVFENSGTKQGSPRKTKSPEIKARGFKPKDQSYNSPFLLFKDETLLVSMCTPYTRTRQDSLEGENDKVDRHLLAV